MADLVHVWNGGECPEHPASKIKPFYRGDADATKGTRISCAPAARLDWSHDGGPDDITSYVVQSDASGPRNRTTEAGR